MIQSVFGFVVCLLCVLSTLRAVASDTGSGTTGSGTGSTGSTGSGTTDTGSGTTGSGTGSTGSTGSGTTDTGSGTTGSGTGSTGSTGSGSTGATGSGSSAPPSSAADFSVIGTVISNMSFANTRNIFSSLRNRFNELINGSPSPDDEQNTPGEGDGPPPAVEGKRLGYFVSGQNAFGTGSSFNYGANGVLAGVDYRFTETTVLGVYGGYQEGKINVPGNTTDWNSAQYGIYGATRGGYGGWVSGNVGGALHDYSIQQATLLGGTSGRTHGTEINGQLAAGQQFKVRNWNFGGQLAAGYSHLWLDGFNAQGLAAPMPVGARSTDSLTSTAALTASYEWRGNRWAARPFARVGFTHEFLNNSPAGPGGSGQWSGVVVDAGLQFRCSDAFSSVLSYSLEANGQFQIHRINYGLSFGF